MLLLYRDWETEKILNSIGARVRNAREAAGLTQEELGDALGISGNGVAKIESGRSALILNHLLALPKILDKPVAWFLDLPGAPGLTPHEAELLQLFRALPPETRELALSTLLGWVERERHKAH